MIQEALATLSNGRDLSREQAADAMHDMMSGEATPAQMGAFLMGLRVKGETVEEITGMAETMRAFATRITSRRSPLVDTCGTGGDRSGTFNISTTVAFVAAGAGVAIAKHGNRSATSKCGSADVLEALGVNIDASPERVGRCIDDIGIGFLFARKLHGAMRHVGPVRVELRVRTIFNILGPLTNPAGADGQVIGIFDEALVEPMASVLAALGARHGFVVHGCDGLDELTLSGPSKVAEAREGAVNVYEVSPTDYGIALAPVEALLGGDASDNAKILRAILEGERGPRRDAVLYNAAPAIVAGGVAPDWHEGLKRAAEAIDSGAALKTLEDLIRLSNDS